MDILDVGVEQGEMLPALGTEVVLVGAPLEPLRAAATASGGRASADKSTGGSPTRGALLSGYLADIELAETDHEDYRFRTFMHATTGST